MIGLNELATATVTCLAPYLAESGKEAAKKFGGAVADRVWNLYQTLKTKLTSPAASEYLADFEKTPEDSDAQARLQLRLKKLLAEDSQLREELAALLQEIDSETGGVRQTATTIGDENVTIQIAGSGNTVGLPSKKS